MIATDKIEFLKLIADVHKFYRQDASTFALGVWWTTMQQFELAAVADALGRHTMNPDTGQFMPKPADVVKMLQGSTNDSALIAWTKVDRAIRQVGPYQSVCFDDALINAVLAEMGGWIELSRCEEDEWPFKRNEFVNRYRGYRMRSAIPQYPRVLIGLAEADNARHGRPIPQPILIGNHEQALLVLKSGSSMPALSFRSISECLPKSLAA